VVGLGVDERALDGGVQLFFAPLSIFLTN
jgi:hypothetical protein